MRQHRLTVVLIAATAVAIGQEYTISTVAGGAPPPTPASAITASIGQPLGVATDAAGNTYFTSLDCVFKIDSNGTLTRVAGNARIGSSGDGGAATSAQLNSPRGVAVDDAGNLYIADFNNHRIRRVTPGGIITTVAGNGIGGYSGDGGAATSAQLWSPHGVAADDAGNLYIADFSNQRIRRVTPGGIITTVAGNGIVGYSGDGGAATSAALRYPYGVAVDAAGNLYVADTGNQRIRRVTPGGIITTVAGNGIGGYSGDGGAATSTYLNSPASVAVDAAGNLYIADRDNSRIRRVTPGGTITTVTGNGTPGYSGDGGSATSALLYSPVGVAVDADGNLYIADTRNSRIRRVTPGGTITTVAGNGTVGYSGDGGAATSAQLFFPYGVAVDAAGNMYIGDNGNHRIRRVTPGGIITTVAGNGNGGYSGDGGAATSAQLELPFGVAVDAAGNLYVADAGNHRIRRVTPGGIITTVAGNWTGGYSGDGGAATSAQLFFPYGVAVDAAGNLYIADRDNNRIRRVTPGGIITTVAGNGTQGYSGDGGAATGAQLNGPRGVAVDDARNLYIADYGNSRIRRVTPGGIITTVAGNGTQGYSGDGGAATSAQVCQPVGVAMDDTGNLYIGDVGNSRIRRVTPGGIITTVAGNGTPGYSGDGDAATSAQLRGPYGVAVDATGRIYFTQDLNAVRLLTPTSTACTYAATPTTLSLVSSGGNLSLTIATSVGCAWTLTGLPAWVSASATSGSGPATLTLTVDTNPGAARSATFTAAGVSITVSQAGTIAVCIYSISPGGQAFSSAPGTGSIVVTTQPGCTWTASNALVWANITSGASGTGNGMVTYQVLSNALGPARSGTMTIAGRPFNLEQLGTAPAGLISGGSMAQVASGGGWKTTFTLVNNGATAAQFRLVLTSDSGTELTLPLSFPQTGIGPVLASTLERTLNPGATLIIECEGPVTQDTQQGAAQLLSNGAISGFAMFRQSNGDAEQEAVVPLETRSASAYVLPFDNTTGIQTGVAVANLVAQAGASVVVIKDDAGSEVMSTTLNFVARGHTAFVLTSLYAPTTQRRGTIEFRPPTGGQISVLGLRFSPKGAVTTIPVLVK